jgi:hypothetical protein
MLNHVQANNLKGQLELHYSKTDMHVSSANSLFLRYVTTNFGAWGCHTLIL